MLAKTGYRPCLEVVEEVAVVLEAKQHDQFLTLQSADL